MAQLGKGSGAGQDGDTSVSKCSEGFCSACLLASFSSSHGAVCDFPVQLPVATPPHLVHKTNKKPHGKILPRSKSLPLVSASQTPTCSSSVELLSCYFKKIKQKQEKNFEKLIIKKIKQED